MVTVRKPDTSTKSCIDFKRINEVTVPMPFYIPGVEEVLEAARVISNSTYQKGTTKYPEGSRHRQNGICMSPGEI